MNKIDLTNNYIYKPQTFDEYIGQEKAKNLLDVYIRQTIKRKKIFPHTLIYGQAGIGKTTLARIIARSLGVSIIETIASNLDDEEKIYSVLKKSENKVLFLDEIHSMDRCIVEKLHTVMEDFLYNDEYIPFTLIGASTEVGEIIKKTKPFYDRFKLKLKLENYTLKELQIILKQYMRNVFPEDNVNESVYDVISKNCRLTPRIAISLLENTVYLNGNCYKSLYYNNIIKDGYTFDDMKVLDYISQNEKGVGVNSIGSYLGTSVDNYTYEIEPYLLSNAMIIRTARGRIISDKGKDLLKELKISNKRNNI